MAETQKLLSNKTAKLPWVHGRGLDTFYPRRTCNSSKARQMANAWTIRLLFTYVNEIVSVDT